MEEEGQELKGLFGPNGLKQVSPSLIQRLQQCEAYCYFRDWMGFPSRNSSWLARGKAVDAGVTRGYSLSLLGNKAKSKDLVDCAVSALEEEHFSSRPIFYEAGMSLDSIKADISRSLPTFWELIGKKVKVSDKIQPQQEITVSFPNGGPNLVCILDVAGVEKGVIVPRDTKTAAKAWGSKKAVTGLQAYFYCYAVSKTGLQSLPMNFKYDVLAFNQVTASCETHEVWVGEEWGELVENWIKAAAARLNSFATGALPVPNRASFKCGVDKCEYASQCAEMFGGNIP